MDLAAGEAHRVGGGVRANGDVIGSTSRGSVRGGRYGIHEGGESGGQVPYGAASYIRAARVASGYRDTWPQFQPCTASTEARFGP